MMSGREMLVYGQPAALFLACIHHVIRSLVSGRDAKATVVGCDEAPAIASYDMVCCRINLEIYPTAHPEGVQRPS